MILTQEMKDIIARMKRNGKSMVEVFAHLRGHQYKIDIISVQKYYLSIK